jgi:hypothetical protein
MRALWMIRSAECIFNPFVYLLLNAYLQIRPQGVTFTLSLTIERR